jgi:hypothetical protein
MKDLETTRMMWVKGILLLLIAIVSAVLILAETANLKLAVLLGVTIWAFCRAYYFAFYVIEHYVDSTYRFSGLWSFVAYCWRRRASEVNETRGAD